jgi:GNAT superfamily N-acetyltransferase
MRFADVHVSTLRLSEAKSSDILKEIYRLRVKAWRTRIAIPDDVSVWCDRFDTTARHWVFLDGERPVAAARLTVSTRLDEVPDAEVYKDVLPDNLPGPIASLTRLVVDPEYRGRGLARRMDVIRVSEARVLGCAHAIVAAHEISRMKQLQSLGFSAHAPVHPNGPNAGIIAGTLPLAIGLLRLFS